MKPFHKHIGRPFKSVHIRITKYLLERDTMFATAWVFIFILMVGLIPLNTHFFDPIKLALEDFDFNDIAYSKLGKGEDTKFDNRVVIVNIGHADREGMAMMIEAGAAQNPKVMGLDAFFETEKDPHQDSVLREVFEKNKNLVVISRFKYLHHGEEIELMEDHFQESFAQQGFANVVGEDRGSIRHFAPFEQYKGKEYNSFAAQLVKNYDPPKFERLFKRHKETEIIDYSRRTEKYLVVEGEDLMAGNIADSTLTGKIVLFGYVNTNPNDIEDKVFTPMNEKFAGKSIPDMNGIVVHANIISQILDGRYIKKLPSWVTWLVAILVGWLHMSFFLHYYLENHIWFHLVAKLAQLASAILFGFIGTYLFDRYRVKLDMSKTLVVIALSVDIIYFYEAWAVWMHKKFNYKTVFHQKHH
ncbi:MAG: CHASE2 domain-containing protein [Chitinophagaceae bacterium]|nr:CHASE2 domain-containing protein [Chitinophagaceae bacterium]